MANETQIGQLVIDLKTRTEALEKGLETAKKKLQEIEKENGNLEKSNKSLDASFVAMSAGIVASLVKIKSAVDSGLDAYKEYESASKGLESIVKGQGLSFNNAQGFIQEYISDGLIPLSDATLAYKNLAARGYNEDQIKKTMLALKDAAAFGRQSTYEYGQAIATATEGLKNENSVLVDNAGVTKNVAKMWQDYAKSMGKTTEQLTQQEKIQAEVNGILEESKHQNGDAAKYAETFAGQQAKSNAAVIELKKTYGDALIPTMTSFNKLQAELIKGLTTFINNNKGATAGITTFSAKMGIFTVALGVCTKALNLWKDSTIKADIAAKGLKATLESHPILLIATTLFTAISGYTSLMDANKMELEENIRKTEEATQRTNEYIDAMSKFSEKHFFTDEEKASVEKEKKAVEDIIKQYEDLNDKIEIAKNSMSSSLELGALQAKLEDLNSQYMKNGKTLDDYKNKLKIVNEVLKQNQDRQKFLNKTSVKTHQETLRNIAQTQADIRGKQELLNILKKGETTTQQYTDAKKQLVKVYPELAQVNENTINSTQGLIDSESEAAKAEWALAQSTILNSIAELSAMQANDEKVQQIAIATQQKVEDVRASIGAATASLVQLSKLSLDDYSANITSNYTPKVSSGVSRGGGGSKAYQNKKLDEYKELIEYKNQWTKLALKLNLRCIRLH